MHLMKSIRSSSSMHFHLLHTPLQVPKYYFDQIEESVISKGGRAFDSENRRLIMAMTKLGSR